MSKSKFATLIAPAAVGLLTLGAVVSNAAKPAPQAAVQKKEGSVIVYLRPEVFGIRSQFGGNLGDKRFSTIGSSAQISSDSVQVNTKDGRVWIPRENVLSIHFND